MVRVAADYQPLKRPSESFAEQPVPQRVCVIGPAIDSSQDPTVSRNILPLIRKVIMHVSEVLCTSKDDLSLNYGRLIKKLTTNEPLDMILCRYIEDEIHKFQGKLLSVPTLQGILRWQSSRIGILCGMGGYAEFVTNEQ
ncbi:MAG: hypothetical protein Q9170_002856 [Blastenia crenularia]